MAGAMEKLAYYSTLLRTGHSEKAIQAFQHKIVDHGDHKYQVHLDWAKVDRSALSIRNCHEMVMHSKKRLVMVTDHPKNNIVILDRSGAVTDSWTLNYRGPHGLSISSEGGEERVFICIPPTSKVIKPRWMEGFSKNRKTLIN